MKDVISVIVPVYNVSAYLPECLDSILSQDYEKLEVILIDDGSTDDSGAICDAYAQRDSRIRVIHQKNGGAAAAKNAGLRAAAGEYLSFADSDDFLEPKAYAYMMSLLKETRRGYRPVCVSEPVPHPHGAVTRRREPVRDGGKSLSGAFRHGLDLRASVEQAV